MASGERPASAYVEAEAEESGDEAGREEDEEEAENDDGRDLEGFITNEPEEGDQQGEGGSSSSGEEDAMDEELHEEDLAVLQEAGLDISQVQSQRRPREGKVEGEPPSRRRRTETEDLEAELFGDVDEGPEGRELVPAAGGDDLFEGLSEGESVDDFVVEDPGRKRERKAQAAEFDISEEQLQEVVDIFGDTSVLRPIDELPAEPELPPPILPELVPEAPEAPEEELAEPEITKISVPDENMEMDPDLKLKLYETKRDFILEVRDAPERWIQAYEAETELLDRDGVRRWTDEEHDCEAKWIYNVAFWGAQYERPAAEAATRQILDKLHTQMLEPIYVVTQFSWMFLRLFTVEDLWKIVDLDRQWQSIWVLYRRLSDWVHKVEDGQLPAYISAKVDQRVWDQVWAEQQLKDTYDWFSVMYPELALSNPSGKQGITPSEAQKIALVRQSKFDEKLGIKESIESMSLQVFGITPAELGDNVENGKQLHTPSTDMENKYSLHSVCSEHISSTYQTPEAVQEAVMMYLSRLIASDPRIRKYVRQEFWHRCAVSTTVTEVGKSVAMDAAHSFRKSYRAFHLVNRPVTSIEKAADELFLDVLHLQRKGLIDLEYSLIVEDTKNKETNPNAYRYVMLGHDDSDIVKDRTRITEHFRKMNAASGDYLPNTDEDMQKWNWCKAMQPRLEAVARAHEIENRRKGAAMSDANEKANSLFKCARMNFSFDHLNNFITHDPIFTYLLKLYCTVEAQGMNEVFVVPNEWNIVRKKIILRVLRDELYPLFWQEVQVHLCKLAEDFVCKQCCEKLLKIADVQPWHLTEQALREQRDEDKLKYGGDIDDVAGAGAMSDDEDDPDWAREKRFRLAGCCSILVVINDVSAPDAQNCVLALVNAFGDPIDMRVVFKAFYKPMKKGMVEDPLNHRYMQYLKMQEHKEAFKQMLKKHKPAIILLPVNEREVLMMKDNIQSMIDEREMAMVFKMKPVILLGDPSVSRVVAYHSRAMEEGVYRDCQLPLQRIAISCARFVQDPLAEICQLWHELPEENGVFRLRLHRLQHAVSKDRLTRALMVPLMETIAKVGVHVNRLRRSPHLMSLAVLLAGLGPRKARSFRKCLADAVTSRQTLAEHLTKFFHRPGAKDPMRSPVVVNAMPFIKICPDLRDTWNVDTMAGLDRTRLGESFRPWMTALCSEAMKLAREQQVLEEDQDLRSRDVRRALRHDPLAQAITEHSRQGTMTRILQEVNLDEWQTLAGVQDVSDNADLDALLTTLIPEVTEPYKDQRQEFSPLDDTVAFYLTIGDNEDNVSMGSVVHAVVQYDQEYPPEGRTAGRTDTSRATVNVNVLPGMVRGSFMKMHRMNRDQAGYITGCNRRFVVGETVLARIVDIRAYPGRPYMVILSVDTDEDLWAKQFPIQDDDAPFFVPLESENWTKTRLGVMDASQVQEKEALKDWVRRPRNIRHTNWTDADHHRALEIINHHPLGNVIFRPSRRHDIIVAMLKVRNTIGEDAVDPSQCFRTFDVIEKQEKTVSKGYEIAKELEVDGCMYNNFDEIIARHMDPIMENLRVLQEHAHYGLKEGSVTHKFYVKEGLADFTKKDPKSLHYVFLLHDVHFGHAMLLWALGGHKPREELIEVTPSGYTLWLSSFESLPALVRWFKEVGWRNASHCRKDWLQVWEKKNKEAAARRGPDAFADRSRAEFRGWAPESTLKSGLQTPMAAAGTPTFYGMESAAPTPRGLATPGGAYGSGYRTPDARLVPGSPAPMKGAPMTPTFQRTPTTPGGLLFRGGSSYGAAPSTPRAALQPATPAAIAGAGSRPGAIPMTPISVSARRGPGPVPRTPAEPVPHTPATAPATPQTPMMR